MMSSIRWATLEDMTAMHTLIHELAIYEKAPEEHVVTVDQLKAHFIAQQFEAIVAEVDNEVVGMLLFYEGYSTWKGPFLYIEDFMVTSTHRRKGIGRQLFEKAIGIATERGCSFAKWQVLDWNTPAIAFYEQFPIHKDTTWVDCKYFLKR